jgi:hypothetical protein
MTEIKRFYVLGDIYHQDDSGSPTELLGDADNLDRVSEIIKGAMDHKYAKNVFVIEGIRKEIVIDKVSLK